MKIKKVSVCIPVYNGERYLAETIQSVISQTYRNLEILIQDNASTDGTWTLVNDLAAIDQRIVLARNFTVLPMASNWNVVINRATGDYIMLLSADDLLLPHFVEKCVGVLEDSHVDAVTCNHLYLNGAQSIRKRRMYLREMRYDDFPSLVLAQNPFSINFTLFKSSTIRDLRKDGRLFYRSLYTCDYDLWLRAALGGISVAYLSQRLGIYRLHDNNLSTQRLRMNRHTFLVLTGLRDRLRSRCLFQYKTTIARLLLRHLFLIVTRRIIDRKLFKAEVYELFAVKRFKNAS